MIRAGIVTANAGTLGIERVGKCQTPHRAETKIAESQGEPLAFPVLRGREVERSSKRGYIERSDYETNPGTRLTCIGAPKSDLMLDALEAPGLCSSRGHATAAEGQNQPRRPQ